MGAARSKRARDTNLSKTHPSLPRLQFAKPCNLALDGLSALELATQRPHTAAQHSPLSKTTAMPRARVLKAAVQLAGQQVGAATAGSGILAASGLAARSLAASAAVLPAGGRSMMTAAAGTASLRGLGGCPCGKMGCGGAHCSACGQAPCSGERRGDPDPRPARPLPAPARHPARR
jgi:hypothetical protein